ncbi:MAG: hypothetical protein KAR23_03090 [Candidatus Aenigmarchaeota archaeon]|nr:hypothetical protein [Candidatus Aenigmarchaeota archaeon]
MGNITDTVYKLIEFTGYKKNYIKAIRIKEAKDEIDLMFLMKAPLFAMHKLSFSELIENIKFPTKTRDIARRYDMDMEEFYCETVKELLENNSYKELKETLDNAS